MFPHFLCIGAQKAGTTWLYDNIKQHPQVWMTPVKEIFYFDVDSRAPLLWQICQPRNSRLRGHVTRGIVRRASTGPREGQASGAGDSPTSRTASGYLHRAMWHLRFMLLPRNDRFYESLFRPREDQIAGDINPYLAHQHRDRVEHIHSLMPDAKIIYLLRDPVDRQWSELAMAVRDGEIESIKGPAAEAWLSDENRPVLDRYLNNFEAWREFYPEEQIMVRFFDQLCEDPAGLLKDVCEFLGVNASDVVVPKDVTEKRNPSGKPAALKESPWFLTRQHVEDLEKLHEHFANQYTERWLKDAQAALAKKAPTE